MKYPLSKQTHTKNVSRCDSGFWKHRAVITEYRAVGMYAANQREISDSSPAIVRRALLFLLSLRRCSCLLSHSLLVYRSPCDICRYVFLSNVMASTTSMYYIIQFRHCMCCAPCVEWDVISEQLYDMDVTILVHTISGKWSCASCVNIYE